MLENGYFKSETFAWSEDGKHCARVTQRGKGSPGYHLTATMMCVARFVGPSDARSSEWSVAQNH